VHTLENGARVPFLTMELLDGPSLAQYLGRVGRLAPEAARPIVDQLSAALEAAHQAGVVHRDFKPQNVIILEGRPLKAVVTDFGVARAFDGDDWAPTRTNSRGLVGSPAYMAPEQVEGRSVGPAADLYALGVVMFEMLTGSLPFEGETPLLTAVMRLERTAPSVRARAADVVSRWERVIARCLEREPQKRPSSAHAVSGALAARPAKKAGWHFVAAGMALGALFAAFGWHSARPKPERPAQVTPMAAPPVRAEKPAPGPVKVIVRSDPSGARVVVDDQTVGSTPALISLRLPSELELTLDGYQPARQRVQAPGEITIHLSRARPHPRRRLRLLDE
jgi:hypothetical protein